MTSHQKQILHTIKKFITYMKKEIDYYEEHIGNDDYDIEYLIMNPFLKHWDRIFQKTTRCDEMIHRSATRHVESMKQLIDQA